MPRGFPCEKIGGIFEKVSFTYDHKNKMHYDFDTLGHGGHRHSFPHYRSDPHIRPAPEAAVVQKCCCGHLWLNGVGPGSIKGGINEI